MNVRELLAEALVRHKFDGLYNEKEGCACLPDDLAPCGNDPWPCHPGYKTPCTCNDGHDFHISPERDSTPAAERRNQTK